MTHADPLINNVFEGYELSQFEQSFPSSSNPELLKFYTIGYNSKELFLDIGSSLSGRFIFDNPAPVNEILSSIIDFVDGKEFNLDGFYQVSDIDPCSSDCPFVMVSNEFYTRVAFEYDAAAQLLTMETVDVTSCGNQFSISFAGPNDIGGSGEFQNAQTWRIDSFDVGANNQGDECFNVESTLFSLFELACNELPDGQLGIITRTATDELILKKDNVFGGELAVLLRDASLSVDENQLDNVIVFETENNPYLQVENKTNRELDLRIFDLNGREVIGKTALINNTINITALQKGTLYLISLNDNFGDRNTIKFIKQ
ncbi:hypothetical protein ULMS_16020 [Patiriisocius marinistellae]|uniref:Secretion system C-terminal sorting domain-containing protein n=1 Tax=Patiriisocius marinistellae TaxID=2494560 RepID=A0A5J4FY41_9FLAO|nr:T9SS type A sorting domain-containing protein [Patiriisocius marinistellae]GEQ86094.1 hypothetical protein ULMS_16020 [Patiriisocius marinistellae]